MQIWLGKNYLDQKEPKSEEYAKTIEEIQVYLHPKVIST
jgi:hypothetical protein